MIRIEAEAWERMVSHAQKTYPNECCGAMLGSIDDGVKTVSVAIALENSFTGEQGARYEIRQEDLLKADAEARRQGLDLVGIFHSHPDCDAYFSKTDLENSCPWYSFVVLSIKNGELDHANSFLPDPDQTRAEREEIEYPDKN
jgi:proteasome lid subunit RPN8/RPN11